MEKLILILLCLIFTSCGNKSNSSKASFSILAGGLTDAEVESQFPGGLLIAGRSLDGTQSFTLAYHSGLELELKKGPWEFATIGWIGPQSLEGNQKCSMQETYLNTDSFTVEFEMTKPNCLNLSNTQASKFTDPIFYNFTSGIFNGFKKLNVKTCPDLLTNCTSGVQTAPYSFNAEIPAILNGISLNQLPKGLKSNCVTGGTSISDITPPHGGKHGFLNVRVNTFGLPVTSFNNPNGVVVDASGNLYIANSAQHNIRKKDTSNIVTTYAGPAGPAITMGSTNATGQLARFQNPKGLTIDVSGNIFVADTYNHTIRKIDSSGVVTTLAGLAGSTGPADGTGGGARFNAPYGIVLNPTNNILYVADTNNNLIRKITPAGVVTTFAGSGVAGAADGTGTLASFKSPRGIAIDNTNSFLYVADTQNHLIRKINISSALVTTLAGSSGISGHVNATGPSAEFNLPSGITVDSIGKIFVADTNNQMIRQITSSGSVSDLAGVYATTGSTNGGVAIAKFNYPEGVFEKSGDIFVADTLNQTIRKINSGVVTTIAGHAGVSGNNDTGDSAGCTGEEKSFYFPHGDGEVKDELYYVSALPYHKKAALSLDVGSLDAGIALAPFAGIITDPLYIHLPSTPGSSAIYFYNGGTTFGSPLYAPDGSYLYYDGAGWSYFTESDSVKLLLQP